jgi:outer membrane lipoprotein-sorting protein
MKRSIIYIIVLFTTYQASAQQDAKAKSILNAVSQKFKAYTVVKADFTFMLDNPQAGSKQSQNGALLVNSKAGKYKITLSNPVNKAATDQEIISDGKTQWTYSVQDKEAQVASAAKANDEMNPSQLFTMYEHGYKYLYTGDEKLNGKLCAVIDLSPENTDKPFFKIRLYIDKAKQQIYRATLFDKNGAKYIYTLNTVTPNVKVPDDTFIFDKAKHPGVNVVDLR